MLQSLKALGFMGLGFLGVGDSGAAGGNEDVTDHDDRRVQALGSGFTYRLNCSSLVGLPILTS